jgi:hypothetical protein
VLVPLRLVVCPEIVWERVAEEVQWAVHFLTTVYLSRR